MRKEMLNGNVEERNEKEFIDTPFFCIIKDIIVSFVSCGDGFH